MIGFQETLLILGILSLIFGAYLGYCFGKEIVNANLPIKKAMIKTLCERCKQTKKYKEEKDGL